MMLNLLISCLRLEKHVPIAAAAEAAEMVAAAIVVAETDGAAAVEIDPVVSEDGAWAVGTGGQLTLTAYAGC